MYFGDRFIKNTWRSNFLTVNVWQKIIFSNFLALLDILVA